MNHKHLSVHWLCFIKCFWTFWVERALYQIIIISIIIIIIIFRAMSYHNCCFSSVLFDAWTTMTLEPYQPYHIYNTLTGLEISGCWESLISSAAPSNFCREPKNVLVSIHNMVSGFWRCNWAPWKKIISSSPEWCEWLFSSRIQKTALLLIRLTGSLWCMWWIAVQLW